MARSTSLCSPAKTGRRPARASASSTPSLVELGQVAEHVYTDSSSSPSHLSTLFSCWYFRIVPVLETRRTSRQ
eukprot:scaffold33878_cov90-Isochrysis_galbana.AAC.1